MQRDDQRRGDTVDQLENQVARGPTKDAEFMLKPDRGDSAAIDRYRCGAVGNRTVVVDWMGNRRIAALRERRTHRVDLNVADRKSCAEGQSVSVRVDLGGRRIMYTKTVRDMV